MSNTNRAAANSKPTGTSQEGSVNDLTQRNVELIRQLEASAKRERTRSDLVAEAIANFCGSMTFVWVHVVWFGAWVILNLAPGIPHLDTFPFTFSHAGGFARGDLFIDLHSDQSESRH